MHAVDNPSFESEVQLLKEYAPSIDEDYLHRIARAFGDLRRLADEGTISYPYSTREAVNIVKHLQVGILQNLHGKTVCYKVNLDSKFEPFLFRNSRKIP